MPQKHKTNNSLLSVLDFASRQTLVVNLDEENEELLSGGHTGEDILRARLTARDVAEVTGSAVSYHGIRSIPTLMISEAAIVPPTGKIRGTLILP
jgi:hypothetical protein